MIDTKTTDPTPLTIEQTQALIAAQRSAVEKAPSYVEQQSQRIAAMRDEEFVEMLGEARKGEENQ